MPEALKKKSLVSSLPNFCLESHVGKVLIGVNFEFPNQQNIAANSPFPWLLQSVCPALGLRYKSCTVA